MFHDFILLKYDLKNIYRENRIKGFFYHKIYKRRVKKLLSNLYNNPVDAELLKEFHWFLSLTHIHTYEEFKNFYSVTLYSDESSIQFIINTEIYFTISVFKDNIIHILYKEGEYNFYLCEVVDNILNFNQRDNFKKQILFYINRKIIDVMITSMMVFFDKDRKG